ncbi:MAG: hypothetical protein V2I41_02200 [Pseudomonadales bacterium]|jgi:hypothetical protein|nr:hypothetical protein [Pseudomonadales bacterium]
MRKTALITVALLAISGCASQTPTFSWYHPMGGEYLFAFDAGECTEIVAQQGQQLGVDTQGPFFQCMHSRGYYLVDAQGIVQAPEEVVLAEGPQISQQ